MLGKLAFALAALLLLAVAAGYGDAWHPALAVAADFRLHLAVLGGGLGVLAGILSLRQSSGFAFVAALAAAAGLGSLWDPGERPGGGRAVTLLYANLRAGNPVPDQLRATLRAADVDILITSETTRAVTDGAGGLRARYPYRVTSTAPGPTLRTAIWSKFPLHQGRVYLNNTVAPTAAIAAAEIGAGRRLGLIGAHFSRADEGLRRAQTDALGPMAARLPHPLLLAGDFNAAPWSWVATRAAKVTGTRILGGYRITWKGDYPTPLGPVPAPWGHQIDHVLVSGGIGVEEIATIALPGSDHRGVLVRLRVAAFDAGP